MVTRQSIKYGNPSRLDRSWCVFRCWTMSKGDTATTSADRRLYHSYLILKAYKSQLKKSNASLSDNTLESAKAAQLIYSGELPGLPHSLQRLTALFRSSWRILDQTPLYELALLTLDVDGTYDRTAT